MALLQVANFEYVDEAEVAAAREEERQRQSMLNKGVDSNAERANYWSELLKDRYEMHQTDEHSSLGKGKRSRKQVNMIFNYFSMNVNVCINYRCISCEWYCFIGHEC